MSERSAHLATKLMREREGDVLKKYEIIKIIGEGSMGSVSKARVRSNQVGGSAYKNSGGCLSLFCPRKSKHNVLEDERRSVEMMYALKTIILSRVSPEFIEELRNEIGILKSLDHPNIVKAFEVFENKNQKIYIVMELCSGGDLYRRLPYSEKEAAKISGKLLSAIAYMHDNDVVHRDLKFENIMFENNTPEAEIKVIDFGLSRKFLPEERTRTMTEGVGTIYTMAPQVLQGVYTSKADLWSCGVISFMLLSSQKPFYDKRRKKLIDKIMRAHFQFRGVLWEQVSSEAKDFVSKLLVLDPKERMSATQALNHAWLGKTFKLSDRRPTEDLMRDVHVHLVAYKNSSDLKKLALNVIAHKSSTDEIKNLRQVFDQYDENNDGSITFSEFKEVLAKETTLPEQEVRDIFESIDVNNNGHIMYTEFLAATLEARGNIEEERIAEAFDRIDSDDSGYISRENLKEILGPEYNNDQIDKIIGEADTNHDGKSKLTLARFATMFELLSTDSLQFLSRNLRFSSEVATTEWQSM